MAQVIHKKFNRASNLFFPIGKKIWCKESLKYEITFTDSCLYPPLPNSPITGKDENSSWNKLIYMGNFDPHTKGANFGWRHYKGKLEICARYYDNDSGDTANHIVLWEKEIQPNVVYRLENRNSAPNHLWLFNGAIVARYKEPMPTGWLSAPWFGGGDGRWNQGNVPNQDIKMIINMS